MTRLRATVWGIITALMLLTTVGDALAQGRGRGGSGGGGGGMRGPSGGGFGGGGSAMRGPSGGGFGGGGAMRAPSSSGFGGSAMRGAPSGGFGGSAMRAPSMPSGGFSGGAMRAPSMPSGGFSGNPAMRPGTFSGGIPANASRPSFSGSPAASPSLRTPSQGLPGGGAMSAPGRFPGATQAIRPDGSFLRQGQAPSSSAPSLGARPGGTGLPSSPAAAGLGAGPGGNRPSILSGNPRSSALGAQAPAASGNPLNSGPSNRIVQRPAFNNERPGASLPGASIGGRPTLGGTPGAAAAAGAGQGRPLRGNVVDLSPNGVSNVRPGAASATLGNRPGLNLPDRNLGQSRPSQLPNPFANNNNTALPGTPGNRPAPGGPRDRGDNAPGLARPDASSPAGAGPRLTDRPGLGNADRPGNPNRLTPGNRPATNLGNTNRLTPGNRPATNLGNTDRPGNTDRLTPGNRPATNLGNTDRPTLGNRPGRGPGTDLIDAQRPGARPGQALGLGQGQGLDLTAASRRGAANPAFTSQRPVLDSSRLQGRNGGADRLGGLNRGGSWGLDRPVDPGFGRGTVGAGRGRFHGLHNSWERGFWTGYRNGFIDGSLSNRGGWGWGGGGWGGGGLGFWNPFAWGFGSGLGWGLGSSLGWGLGGGGLGGWGWGGAGLGGWGLGGGGLGLSSWCFGTPYYSWGYGNYYNPYAVGGFVDQPLLVASNAAGAGIFDYTQPIAVDDQAPEADEADQALAIFDQARAAFKQNQYEEALRLVDSALVILPQDATLHEFRSLSLFALGRFDEAAAVIYAVLAVGPGWDWPTLIGLYSDVDTYTAQLRTLENLARQNPDQPAPRFLLAYHYLTQGHPEEAATQLRRVVSLQPKDQISTQLLASLTTPEAPAPPPQGAPAPFAANPANNANDAAAALVAPEAQPAQQPANEPQKEFPIEGTWTATNPGGTLITLTILPDHSFTWSVQEQNQPRDIQGTSTLGTAGLLTLAGSDNGVLVGRVTWTDQDNFTFRLIGGNQADPGLAFTRAAR